MEKVEIVIGRETYIAKTAYEKKVFRIYREIERNPDGDLDGVGHCISSEIEKIIHRHNPPSKTISAFMDYLNLDCNSLTPEQIQAIRSAYTDLQKIGRYSVRNLSNISYIINNLRHNLKEEKEGHSFFLLPSGEGKFILAGLTEFCKKIN
ncbi:hypothetical protein M0R72_03360 [Candidatus Pacearchaeota archaeon]|jgi:hypothetical protein|nr:hypothetical protein [Candidatus Pacearchaeota archaeon]